MICRFCGAELPENTTICSVCGKLLPEDVPTQQPASAQGETVCIRFLDEDGHVLQSTTYRVGARILAPKPKDFFYLDGVSYYFNGWNPAPPAIAETSADFQACYSPNSMQPVKPVLDREQPKPEKKQATPPPPPIICEYPAPPRSSKKRLYAIVAACLALCLVLGVGFAIWKPWANHTDDNPPGAVLSGVNTDPPTKPIPSDGGNNGGNTSPEGGETSGTPETPEEPVAPPEWSDWEDTLPASVTEASYDIETKTVYRSCALETTSSSSASMDGWELYDTKKEDGGWGKWSTWSTTAVPKTSTREVEQKTQYRYTDKVTTPTEEPASDESTFPNGLFDSGEDERGAWSDWDTEPIEVSDTQDVEIRTTYRTKILLDGTWTNWTVWYPLDYNGGMPPDKPDSVDVEQRTEYRYRDKKSPATSETPDTGTSAPTDPPTPQEEAWNEWSDAPVEASDTQNVEERTVYRYRDKQPSTTTYYFRRCSNWSEWTDQPIEATDELQVESKPQYHYRAKS